MLDLLDELGTKAADALRGLGSETGDIPPSLTVVKAGRPEFGDYQISQCLQLGKAMRRPPRALAEAVKAALEGHPALARVEIAGPGFVNLTLADGLLADEVSALMDDPTLGLRPVGRGQCVVVDFSSPNVAKPMHIGHIRSTIIGDCLVRAMRALGYVVIGDNHLGDWGTQFGKLIVAYRRWVDEDAFARSPVDELLRLYVKFVDEEKAQRAEMGRATKESQADGESEEEVEEAPAEAPPLLREARAELVKLQAGDPANVALWRRFVDVSLAEFGRIYDRLGVRFDETLGESFYNARLAPTVENLVERGIAEPSEGALVVFFTKERDGEEMPVFLVRKGDGAFLYGTTDLAGILYRVERWNPSRMLYVTDERQQLHFRQLFATARRMGVAASLEHHWFGLMRLPEGTISTRDGKLISLESLLDEAERRAALVAGEHNPELDEQARREVARVVGIGAVKYNDLSKDRQTLVTFSWDRALSLQGNTAPYLQYAYARIRSIVRKAEAPVERCPVRLTSAVERDLVKRLLSYPEALEQVGRTCKPHLLCDYLYDLSTTFSTFYADHPVLKAEPEIRASRLVLTELVSRVLRHGLDLLGIEILDRM